MQCVYCDAELNVHIMLPGSGQQSHYCEHCHRYQPTQSIKGCPGCGQSFAYFQQIGLLGCEHCYIEFKDSLLPLIDSYHGPQKKSKPLKLEYHPDGLARARTAELLRFLANQKLLIENPDKPEISTGLAAPQSKKPGDDFCLRIRMARNLAGLVYVQNLSAVQKQNLEHWLFAKRGSFYQEWPQLQTAGGWQLYSGDEDHIRIAFRMGLASLPGPDDFGFQSRLQAVLNIFEKLDCLYVWQFQADYGYLTACPGLGGAALRISLQMSLTSLSQTRNWKGLTAAIGRAGFEIRRSRPDSGTQNTLFEISLRHHPLDLSVQQATTQVLGLARRLQTRELNL